MPRCVLCFASALRPDLAMPTCSHCGFELAPRTSPPTSCPQCSRPWNAAGVGLPPRFSGGDPGSTLFGVPGDVEHEDSMLGDLSELASPVESRTTPRPPPPPPGRFHFAPPPVPRKPAPEPDPAANEFDLDFESDSGALELDLPDLSEDSGATDLPAPTGQTARGLQLPQSHADLDLPVPSPRGPVHPRVPPPPPSPAIENLPTPAGVSPRSMNLPLPAFGSRPPADVEVDFELPLESDSGDVVGLLAPLELDTLPHPSFANERNLLQPTHQPANLLRPVHGEVEPREQRLAPAGQWVAPAEQNLQTKDHFLTPAEQNLQPVAGTHPQPVAYGRGRSPVGGSAPMPSPGTTGSSRTDAPGAERRTNRALWGALGVLVVLGGGAGAYYAGLFERDEALASRGAPALNAEPSAAKRTGAPRERDPEVLAALRLDGPESYRAALKLATASGDVVGQAEAALLLHLRYGPDAVLAGQARELLSPFTKNDAPFVRRVVGLDALARHDLKQAASFLAGDEPRTRLYRAMLLLEEEHFAEAVENAEAVLATHGDDLAALSIRHRGKLALEPDEEWPILVKSVESHPSHGILRALAVETALARGQLAQAQTLAEGLQVDENAPAPFRARVEGLRGRVAAARGNTVAAIQHFERGLKVDPTNLAVGLETVLLQKDSGALTEASATATTLSKAHPNSLEAALLTVETDIASGRGDEALATLTTLSASHPESAAIPLMEGKVQAMRLQLEQADVAFAKALERDPNLTEAALARARMYAAARQPDAALQQLDDYLEVAQEPAAKVKLLLAKADLLRAQATPDAALAALDSALELDPQNNEAQTQRGILRLRQGLSAEGRQDLMAVFERTGGYPGMTAPLGRILSREGDIERLEMLVGAQVSDPRATPELKLVGVRLRLLQGNSEAAKALAQEVLAREPGNWEAHLLLADAFRQSRDYAEALERINLAQPPEPQAELFLLKGKILEFNGRYAEARPEYQRALAVDPSLSEARFLYGRSLAYAGAGKAAIGELSQVIRETGNRYPAAYAAIGRAQKEMGNYTQAVLSLAKATDLDPTQYEAWYHKGTVHAFKNQHREAAEALAHAVADEASSNEWYPDAWMRLGRARFHLGDQAAAREALERYLASAPPQHAGRGEAQRLLRELG